MAMSWVLHITESFSFSSLRMKIILETLYCQIILIVYYKIRAPTWQDSKCLSRKEQNVDRTYFRLGQLCNLALFVGNNSKSCSFRSLWKTRSNQLLVWKGRLLYSAEQSELGGWNFTSTHVTFWSQAMLSTTRYKQKDPILFIERPNTVVPP